MEFIPRTQVSLLKAGPATAIRQHKIPETQAVSENKFTELLLRQTALEQKVSECEQKLNLLLITLQTTETPQRPPISEPVSPAESNEDYSDEALDKMTRNELLLLATKFNVQISSNNKKLLREIKSAIKSRDVVNVVN